MKQESAACRAQTRPQGREQEENRTKALPRPATNYSSINGGLSSPFTDLLESPAFDEEMMDIMMNGIRTNVIEGCRRRDMGYRELALLSNVHYHQVYKFLNGQVGIGLKMLIKISCGLGVKPGDLIPYNNSHRKTSGERFDEITKGLDTEACNVLLDWCAGYTAQIRRTAYLSARKK